MTERSHDRIRVQQRQRLSEGWAMLESVTFDYLRSDKQWQQQVREVYHRGHGAAVLLCERSLRRVILVRQFRFPAWHEDGDGFLVEVPAGIVEEDDAAATIQAEIEQETGYRITRPQYLFNAYVSPGSVTESIHYFLADYVASDRIAEGGGLADEGEDIEVLEVAFDEAMSWIGDGRIRDAKTIVLLQHAALHVFGGASTDT